MLGKGAVYNEAIFKQKMEQALARGGNVNTALIEASKHCQFHLVQPLVDLGELTTLLLWVLSFLYAFITLPIIF